MAVKGVLALLFATSLAAGCASVDTQSRATCLHRNEKVEREIGFCPAVRSGNTLYISGVTSAGPMDTAVRSVYERLRQTLEANGLTFADVVKETVFATDLEAFIQNKEIRKEFYGPSLPAASWVQVSRLFRPNIVVEVELTAEFRR